MGYFDPGPTPKEITSRWMMRLLELLKLCINNLDEKNFPHQISGRIIKPKTLDVRMSDLEWAEIPVPLILPATAITTTSTAGASLGGYFLWNPSAYKGGDWYFEASLAISNDTGTATATLTGAADIGSVSTQATGLTLVRSQKLTMPTTAQNIWVKLASSNSSYTASLVGARMIFVPS